MLPTRKPSHLLSYFVYPYQISFRIERAEWTVGDLDSQQLVLVSFSDSTETFGPVIWKEAASNQRFYNIQSISGLRRGHNYITRVKAIFKVEQLDSIGKYTLFYIFS